MMHRLTIAAALTGLLAITAPSWADEAKQPRTLTLSGHGEARTAPDMAVVTTGVVTQGATAGEALAANTTAMNGIFAALKAAGLPEKDVQTSNFTVQPRYDYTNNTQPARLVGYDVSNTVTVTLRKIADLGALLDRLVQAGSNQINGISFQVANPDEATDEARKLAAADAERKAKVYAGAMGVTLGPIQSVSEGAAMQPPVPMLRAAPMVAEGMPAPVPIATGEQTLSVDVTVTWELR